MMTSAAAAPSAPSASTAPSAPSAIFKDDLNLIVNKLTDPTSTRKSKLDALTSLKSNYIDHSFAEGDPKLNAIVPVLARLISDKFESCRELAVSCLSLLFQNRNVHPFLHVLVPTLVNRLAGPVMHEPAEELRLSLLKFTRLCMAQSTVNPSVLINDVCQVLFSTLADPFPDVRKESCHLLTVLTLKCPTEIHPHAEKLIGFQVPILSFRHASVRIAALQSLTATTMCNGSCFKTLVWPSVLKLTTDPVANVRKQVYLSTVQWATQLPDRHAFSDLFAYVMLAGLDDELDELRRVCSDGLLQICQVYEAEHLDRIKDALDYLPNAQNVAVKAWVGDRLLQLVDLVVVQLLDWTCANREVAARALAQLIIVVQVHVSGYLSKLLPVMAKTVSDPFGSLIKNAANLMGEFVSPDLILKLVLPHLHLPSYLSLFASMLEKSIMTCSQLNLIVADVHELLMSDVTYASHHLDTLSTVYLHLFSLYTCFSNNEHSPPDAVRILAIGLMLADDPEVKARVHGELMAELPTLLVHISRKRPVIAMHSPTFVLTRQILTHAPLVPALVPVLECMDLDAVVSACELMQHEFSEEFACAVWPWLMRSLEWRSGRVHMQARASVILAVERALGHGQVLTTCPGVTHLDPAPDRPSPSALTDVLVQVANCLDDDLYLPTRMCGCRIVAMVARGGWSAAQVKVVYPELLKRMDDAHDEVRVLAACALEAMYAHLRVMQLPYKSADVDLGGECGMDPVHHEAVVQGITIHVDDQNPLVSSATLSSLREIAKYHPSCVREYIQASTRQYRNRSLFDEFS